MVGSGRLADVLPQFSNYGRVRSRSGRSISQKESLIAAVLPAITFRNKQGRNTAAVLASDLLLILQSGERG